MDWTSWTIPLSIFLSLTRYVKNNKGLPGVGGRKCGAFLSSLDRDPTPLVLGVGVGFAPWT